MMQPEFDEVRCDQCGQPTRQLDPPEETELCDECYAASHLDVQATQSRLQREALNDATFTAYIRKMWEAS